MAQKFTVVGRSNPGDREAPVKFYGLAKSGKNVTLTTICERIAERSSFSKGELVGCVTEFLLETLHVLEEGNIAEMGAWGHFRLNVVTGSPTETAAEFNTSNISKAKVNFWPGSMLRKLCKTVDFSMEKPEEKKENPSQPASEV